MEHKWGWGRSAKLHDSVSGTMEATGGFEPPNRGFADPRLRPLGYVAPEESSGAEEETRTPTA